MFKTGVGGYAPEEIDRLVEWWREADYRVVLTGAGMSTESGLPDFRSPQGLWRGVDPSRIATVSALYENPLDFYNFYRMRLSNLGKARPNRGHEILGKLQQERLLNAIITQNVDGLHQRGGATRVIELHGNLREAQCLKCKKGYPAEVLEEQEIPTCTACGGMIKPGVILFGERLPDEALRQAEMETKRARLFVVIGSSLEVSPANYFPVMARERDAKLAIINKGPTVMDHEADLILRGSAGEILERLYNALTGKA
ncbi:MAG: NAD-dependent deacylase [Peptococcaceae bacterium]|nr:NAD-dependent deacylase [Peptococcaceae bacterium]MDH7525549.1 NAD-dependent deacylase [Peptococcaceae bacterium]